MSENNTSGRNRPTGLIYTIVDRPGGGDAIWRQIGAAWINADGSLNGRLDAYPANGRIHIRAPKKWSEESPGAETAAAEG